MLDAVKMPTVAAQGEATLFEGLAWSRRLEHALVVLRLDRVNDFLSPADTSATRTTTPTAPPCRMPCASSTPTTSLLSSTPSPASP